MSKIPPRQTLAGIGGNKLYVPSDGEGNGFVSSNLEVVNDLSVGGNFDVEQLTANLANITTLNSENITSTETIECTGTGFFVGNGQGLTNVPAANIGVNPSFTFQSGALSFDVIDNRFAPETGDPVPQCTISCDLYGKPAGLYFWKTDANIYIQNLWNSASGMVYWDGNKVSGETTYSLTQFETALNPVYSLTYSYLFYTSLTGFYVTMESSNSSIDPLQFEDYYVNFYKLADLGGGATPLPTPSGVAVTDITTVDAGVSWTQVTDYNYYVYLTAVLSGVVKVFPVGKVASMDFASNSFPLTPNTAYTVEVQATFFSGTTTQVSGRSEPISFTTLAA
jgi:hypothetical protein